MPGALCGGDRLLASMGDSPGGGLPCGLAGETGPRKAPSCGLQWGSKASLPRGAQRLWGCPGRGVHCPAHKNGGLRSPTSQPLVGGTQGQPECWRPGLPVEGGVRGLHPSVSPPGAAESPHARLCQPGLPHWPHRFARPSPARGAPPAPPLPWKPQGRQTAATPGPHGGRVETQKGLGAKRHRHRWRGVRGWGRRAAGAHHTWLTRAWGFRAQGTRVLPRVTPQQCAPGVRLTRLAAPPGCPAGGSLPARMLLPSGRGGFPGQPP